jgi:hypothetical protein
MEIRSPWWWTIFRYQFSTELSGAADRVRRFCEFVTGDSFIVDFSRPVNAIGLNIITNDALINGDSFSLQGVGLAQAAALNGPAVPSDTLDDGGQVYFLGMLSNQAFSSVVFSSVDTELEFALDDMTYAVVPLPPALWLLATGLLSMAGMCRRRQQSLLDDC